LKINDKYILKIFIGENQRVNGWRCSYNWINENPEIKEYLETRFNYFNGKYGDVVRLIRDGFDEWPKCKTCNEFLKEPFTQDKQPSYHIYCSNKCKNINEEKKQKSINTCLEKYGTPVSSQSEIVKEKERNTINSRTEEEKNKITSRARKTYIKKYGVNWISKSKEFKDKFKETWDNKSEEELQDIKNKKENTCLEKYGVKYYFETEEFQEKSKQTILDKYGVEYTHQCKEILDKVNETKHKNGTFNTSRPEEEFYKYLLNNFSENDVKRQYYKDSRYPFRCDFYIKSLDLFIELNLSWVHGGHWFNKNSKEDLKILDKWKNKNTDYYNAAINTWTKRDLLKKKTAIKNKINYLVFWTEKEINNLIKGENKLCIV